MAPGNMGGLCLEELSQVLCGPVTPAGLSCSAESTGQLPCGLGDDLQQSGESCHAARGSWYLEWALAGILSHPVL